MTVTVIVSPSCSAGSCNFCCSGMNYSYNFHYYAQSLRPTSSPSPSASSTRLIMSSEFLGIISLPNPKISTARARSRFHVIFPRSAADDNNISSSNTDVISGKKNDQYEVLKTLQQPQEAQLFTSKMSVANSSCCLGLLAAGLIAAVIVSGAAGAVEIDQVPVSAPQSQSQVQNEGQVESGSGETMENIPQMLSGECASEKDCKKPRIQRPKSRKAESCTIKCVGTCIRGGEGSPGEGPFNVRRPLVVFKEGFRSRRYCLVECSDICNLIGDRDDGP